MRTDVVYLEGPGDIVAAFDSWAAGIDHASETSVTYSSQVFSFCRERHFSLLAISYGPRRARAEGGGIVAENLPRHMWRIAKIGYHLSLGWYACRIFARTLRHRPRLILITSGVLTWSMARLFQWTGATVVPVLHNALWPEGFPPDRPRDTAWWRSEAPPTTLVVSAAIGRQLGHLNPKAGSRVIAFTPSFRAAHFAAAQPQPHGRRPFRIVFAGRLEIDKGALDLVEIAASLEHAAPGVFHLDVCGTGSQSAVLAQQIRVRGLEHVVTLWGRLERAALLQRYGEAHVCVVPTRSSFSEGFAQVVSESILLLRPVVTSPVVPASETYPGAVSMAATDQVQTYVDALLALALDPAQYARATAACLAARPAILANSTSFEAALARVADRIAEESGGAS